MDILIPLPTEDFDPTESAIPWHVLCEAGHRVVFATPDGQPAAADERMITGAGLGPWSPILRARRDARELYAKMSQSDEFQDPCSYDALDELDFDGMILPGGHAPGMKPFVESLQVRAAVVEHMKADKPLGAICHGVLVVARAEDENGSILRGRRSTALPAMMELSAWMMTCLWLGRYYRTYDETVQAEVSRAVGDDGEFLTGPPALLRDRPDRLGRGFTVIDGNYVSARWPGDAYRFANDFLSLLQADDDE